MKKLDTIIIIIGTVALVAGLALAFILEAQSEWGLGCFLLAGIAFLGEALFYIFSTVQIYREKKPNDTETDESPDKSLKETSDRRP